MARPFVPYGGLERSCSLRVSSSLAVAACALYLLRPVRSYRPPGPDHNPDGTETRLLSFCGCTVCFHILPPSMETPALLIGPVVVYRISCFCCHFFLEKGKKSWRRRPIAVLTILLVAIILGTLTPPRWIHTMEPAHECVERRILCRNNSCMVVPALERQGALVFQIEAVP